MLSKFGGRTLPLWWPGEKLSYLKAEEQVWVVDAISNSGIFLSKAQAEQLKAGSETGELTEGKVYAVLVRKGKENVNVTIPAKKISNYFPTGYSKVLQVPFL